MSERTRLVFLGLVFTAVSNLGEAHVFIEEGWKVSLPKFCGKANNDNSEGRISLGGREADVHSWPWMVALYAKVKENFEFSCGGVLISPHYVLTAAHCLSQPLAYVQFGGHTLHTHTPRAIPMVLGVESVIPHPDYTEDDLHNNDLGLVRLAKEILLQDKIHVVCLPTSSLGTMEGKRAVATGWADNHISSGSDALQQIQLKIISNNICRKRYPFLLESTMCGTVMGGKGSECYVDSGGPVVFKNPRSGRYMLIGIVSGGIGCAASESTGVFVRVSRHIGWLKSNVRH